MLISEQDVVDSVWLNLSEYGVDPVQLVGMMPAVCITDQLPGPADRSIQFIEKGQRYVASLALTVHLDFVEHELTVIVIVTAAIIVCYSYLTYGARLLLDLESFVVVWLGLLRYGPTYAMLKNIKAMRLSFQLIIDEVDDMLYDLAVVFGQG